MGTPPNRGIRSLHVSTRLLHLCAAIVVLVALAVPPLAIAQDGSTSLQGVVEDISGARIAGAKVTVLDPARGFHSETVSDAQGQFIFGMLSPGQYDVTASALGMITKTSHGVVLHVGGVAVVQVRLPLAGITETVTVRGEPEAVETQAGDVSQVITQQAIQGLPLNGRRFTDLALLTPGVTQDPRGLTSDSNGDLSFGGTRGFQNSFLVDGADNNNSFFAQARGRYRAPYQFSNEVIKEFRVSSNAYSAELGKAGGAVFNVVTKSGTNNWHGSGFYYLRDRIFDAQQAYVTSQPDDRQQQFGGTIGGPIRKDRLFFYAGFDQHLLTVPSVMQFANGASSVVVTPADYDYTDQQLVAKAAQQLNAMGGAYPTTMQGNAGFGKLDFTISPKQLAFLRLSTSRYTGINNVFFDPASPITTYAESANGTEDVKTESLAGSLTSMWTNNLASTLRVQYSRDAEQSYANTEAPWTKIYNLVAGFGRSSILPRNTREHKLHLADTVNYETGRVGWKFGVDFIQTWIYNYFPSLFGGEYYFSNVKVNPFTYAPMKYGEPLTPLRAYAHEVPRYYMQDFGTAVSHPNSRSYAAFMQDAIRVTRQLTLNVGVRYDLQTFQAGNLITNPLYLPSGKIPAISNNVSPRIGFAYSFGQHQSVTMRGGFGLFYIQIPSMYASQVATDNGVTQGQLFLDNMIPSNAAVFPKYPAALVNCPSGTLVCTAPPSIAGFMTTQISAFAPNFQTPYTEQGNLSVEHQFGEKVTASVSYLYVHGVHLLRSLDANLPPPTIVQYPVYNDTGSVFLGTFYDVASFATWQTTPSATCAYPPCINPVQRPIPQLGVINSFESSSSSVYNGMMVSVKRQVGQGMYFQVAYTLSKAMDDGPDALVVGRPGNVQNSYDTSAERGYSANDQRNRFVLGWVGEPRKFELSQQWLNGLVNHWKFSSIVTFASGRRLNATIASDPNGDGNIYNDRLPSNDRNAFTGTDYFSTDLRVTRHLIFRERAKLDLMVESFNVTNRTNKRVQISDDGFFNSAGQFVAYSNLVQANGKYYPGQYQVNKTFLYPTNAYAPRQVQVALRFNF